MGKSAYSYDDGQVEYVKNSEVSLNTSTPLKDSTDLSFGPIGDPWNSNDGLDPHYWSKFDLVLHTKKATSKLGASTLKLRTSYKKSDPYKATNTTKTIKLNLN